MSTQNVAPAETVKRRGVQISVTVPAEIHDFLEENKWTSRIEIKDQVIAAITNYVAQHSDETIPDVDGAASK